MMLPPLSFTGAKVLRPDGLSEGPLGIAGGRITDVPGRAIDLSDYLILPGIVDPHGDAFERHLAPRRGAAVDLGQGLRATEAELAANGITTAMLAQFWSWEGGMRSPEFARAMCAALDNHCARTDLRVQLRLEIGCFAAFPDIFDLITRHDIGYVVFNDHLPHRHLAQGKRVPRLEGQALKSGRSPTAHQHLLQQLHDQMPDARAALPGFCKALRDRGVLLGSHDDDNGDARMNWREIGVLISEFPTSHSACDAARASGDPIVMGAPNVMRGGSHSKSISAREVLEAGGCTALASDYHYPSSLGAVRALQAEGWPLVHAWNLVSSGPAAMLGLTDRGQLSVGQRADLIVVDPDLQEVQATIVGGQMTYLAGSVAARVLSCA